MMIKKLSHHVNVVVIIEHSARECKYCYYYTHSIVIIIHTVVAFSLTHQQYDAIPIPRQTPSIELLEFMFLLLNFCISILVILVVCILLIEVLILLFVVFAVLWCAILFMSYTMVVCVMTYYPSRGTKRHERARLLRTSAVFFFLPTTSDGSKGRRHEGGIESVSRTDERVESSRWLRFNAFCICLCFRVFGYVLPTNLWVLC